MSVYPVTRFVGAGPGFHHSSPPSSYLPPCPSPHGQSQEPLPPLDVSESLNELRAMICSCYEDSSLSVCSLPLFLPTRAIQNGFGFVGSTGCLACEPLEAGQLKLLLPRPREPHLDFPSTPLLTFLSFSHLPILTPGTFSSLEFFCPLATC